VVAFFKRPPTEETLDARIAGLSTRRAQPVASAPDPIRLPPPALVQDTDFLPSPTPALSPAAALELSDEDRLLLAREELLARLTAELSPERISILSRGELAKVVDAAVQAYFARNGVDADPIARRDLITALLKALLDPSKPLPVADEGGGPRRSSDRSVVDAAKAQIQPLVLEHMDVAAAAICHARCSRHSSAAGSKTC
jgi:hypothetical protein